MVKNMNIQSLWTKEYKKPSTSKKKKMENTDILIIGGGITGISCAYFLKDSGYKVTLVDKGTIGMGITSRTTAKVNYLQGTIYQDLEKNYGKKKSKKYFDSQVEAIKIIGDITKKLNIDCDLEKVDSFLYTNEEKNEKKIEKEKELLKSWDIKVGEISTLPISNIPVKKGIVVPNTYVFHPLKYLTGLWDKIKDSIIYYENTLVQEIKIEENGQYTITTNNGNLLCQTIIIACHYPFFLKPGFFPFFSHLKREYVQAAKIKPSYNFTAINIDSNLQSIRFYKEYLIYGSHEQKLTNQLDYKEGYQKSKDEFTKLFQKEPEYTWMNQDLIMNDSLPWIGILDKKQPNLYIATGYQAWGMTNGTIAGKILSDLILDQENPYIELFSPLRTMKPNVIPTISNGLEYLKAYTKTYCDKSTSFKSPRVMNIKIDGKDCGVYIDENNNKHIIHNLCPHLKCKLVFNESEKTWDCPCHGSRFTMDGDVLEGPATYSIRIQK